MINNTVARGSELPTRDAVIGADSTYGYAFTSLQVGHTWFMDPTDLLRVRTWNGVAEVVLGAADFTIAAPVTDGDLTTIIATSKTDAGLVIVLTVEKEDDGFGFGLSFASGHTTKVIDVEWPRFKLLPPGDIGETYVQFGFGQGFSRYQPHLSAYEISIAMPGSCLPLLAFWDGESKRIFYTFCDDEEGHAVSASFQGFTTSTMLKWVHRMDRRYASGQGFSKTYKVHAEAFVGKSVAGPLCCDDINERFKTWVASPKRPWITKPWKDRTDISTRVKDADVFWVNAVPSRTDHTALRDNLLNLRTHLVSGGVPAQPMINFHYEWSNQLFTTNPDAFGGGGSAVLDATMLAAMDALQAVGIHAQIYTNPSKWTDTGLGGNVYDPNHFTIVYTDPFSGAVNSTTYTDLRLFAMRDKTGARKGLGTQFSFDFTFYTDIRLVVYDVLRRYFAAFTGTTKPHLIYIDTVMWDTLMFEFQDDPARTDWTVKAYTEGQVQFVKFMREQFRRAVDPDLAFSVETTDLRLIPFVDICYPTVPQSDAISTRTFHSVLGRYIRTASYDNPPLFDGFEYYPKALYPLIQAITTEFMESGFINIVSRENGVYGVTVESPVDGSHVLDPLWDWCRILHEAKPRMIKYFQGDPIRDVGGTSNLFRRDMLRQRDYNTTYWLLWNGGQYHTQSITRRADDGDVGIFLFNTYKTGILLPWHPAPATPSQSVTIELDTVIHDLPAGPKRLYQTNLATGARTLLKEFVHDVSVEYTISPFTVALLEVSTS